MIRPETLPMLRTLSMNDQHYEIMILINRLYTGIEEIDIQSIQLLFSELINNMEQHFEHEEEMMLEKGFPPYLAHKEEHDFALDEMREAASLFNETEDINKLHNYLEVNLTPWFMRHTETMDQVTSMFLENSEVHLEFWRKLKPRNSN